MACPTPCDPGCDAKCHAAHLPRWKRDHDPATCHIERGWWRCGNHFMHGPGDDLAYLLFDSAVARGQAMIAVR